MSTAPNVIVKPIIPGNPVANGTPAQMAALRAVRDGHPYSGADHRAARAARTRALRALWNAQMITSWRTGLRPAVMPAGLALLAKDTSK